MFNKRIAIFVIAFIISGVLLIYNWHSQEESALPAAQGVLRTYDLNQNLSGQWEQFPSLRTAWTAMNQGEESRPALYLNHHRSIYLPSTTPVKIAARKFTIPQTWSSRHILLSLRGVYGQANVYLNGISVSHQVAEFDGNGGSYNVLIPPTAFKYGEDNILLVEMTSGSYRANSLFNSNWPKRGMLTGNISIDAVMDHFEDPHVQVEWEEDSKAKVIVSSRLHHSLFKNGAGWTVEGIVSDGSAKVAQSSARIEDDGASQHQVQLEFVLDKPRVWSVDDPFLYHLVINIINDYGDVDQLSLTFGLRRLQFDHAFSLNQESLNIKGIQLSAETEASLRQSGNLRQWLREMKGQGYNLIYFSGHPDELWLDAADQVGIGIWAEWPVNFVAPPNLPDPQEFENLTRAASRHPSMWFWTVGKGLGPQATDKLTSYWTKAKSLLGDTPGFIIEPSLVGFRSVNLGSQIPAANILQTAGDELSVNWAKITAYTAPTPSESREWWVQAQVLIVRGLAVWSILVLWQNIRSRNWRYKELQSPKPKRPLRQSWRWHGIHFLTREIVWAGIITAIIFQADPNRLSFFAGIWPLWDQLLLQSPWLIWLSLTLFIVMLRIMQIGVVAPSMPGSPHILGLVYWMERRYRWYALVAILWALAPVFGIPLLLIPLVYLAMSLLSLPLRVHDVHRAGGKYRGFLLVPLLLLLIPMGWGIWRWPDVVYLSRWVYQIVTFLVSGS